jgi:hypothetical protein
MNRKEKHVLREQHKARAQRKLRLRAATRREEQRSFKQEISHCETLGRSTRARA